MKKILTGCLIVAVIAVAGLGVAMFYAYRMAKPMIDNARLDDRPANRVEFVPPTNDELTAAQVDRFIAVQARVSDELRSRWKELETSRELSALGAIYVEGRRAQVNALNIHKFSDSEYAWVRRRVYEAAGMHVSEKLPELRALPPSQVPDTNIRLIKPHVAKLKGWMPMAVLGL